MGWNGKQNRQTLPLARLMHGNNIYNCPRKISPFYGSEDLIWFRCYYSANWSTDSTQSIKIPAAFCRNRQADLKMPTKMQGTQNCQNNLEKEQQSWALPLPDFKTY